MRSTTNRRTAALCCAALAMAAAAGCSSSKSTDSGDISGARTAPPSSSPTSSLSPTPTQPAGAPEIMLPTDYTVAIQFKPGDDAIKKQAADGLSYALRAFNEAEATGDINRPAMVYAYTGTAGAYMNQAVQQLSSRNQTISGADRYYALTLDVKDPKTVVAAYCEDQSKAFPKDKASGKVLTSTPSINDYTDWTTTLTLTDKGVWQVSAAQAEKGSTRCQSAS
jgi:hypothetical protein